MLIYHAVVSELPPPPVKGGKDDEDMEQDYVYDVFYHRPTTFQELYQPGTNSNIATLYVSSVDSTHRAG